MFPFDGLIMWHLNIKLVIQDPLQYLIRHRIVNSPWVSTTRLSRHRPTFKAILRTKTQSSRYTWWRHQMETFSALLAICAGNSPVPGEFLAQMPVTRSFQVSFDLRLNKRLSKQSWGWWFETLSRTFWRHRNGKMWYELVANNWITARWSCHRIWIENKNIYRLFLFYFYTWSYFVPVTVWKLLNSVVVSHDFLCPQSHVCRPNEH